MLLNLLVYIATAIITLAIVGSLVFFGRRLSRGPGHFIGKAKILWVLGEVGLLNLIPIPVSTLIILLANLGKIPDTVTVLADILIFIQTGGYLVLLPLWTAVRWAVPVVSNPRQYVHRNLLMVLGLFFTVMITSVFGYQAWPVLVNFFLKLIGIDYSILELFPFLGSLTRSTAIAITFIFIRGMMEIVRFTLQRYRHPVDIPSIFISRRRPVASITLWTLILVALALWYLAFILFNRPGTSGLVFVLPITQMRGAFIFAPASLPGDRPPLLMGVLAVPAVFILLLGLFMTRWMTRRISDQAAFLFGVLCGLYGLWMLDVYPKTGGTVFWAIHLLAWLFITPVQIHFALVFPRGETAIVRQLRPVWAWIQVALYGSFALFAPFWLWLYLREPVSLEQLFESQPHMAPLYFLWGAIGLLAVPSAYAIGIYILHRTRQDLPEFYDRITVKKSSGCSWKDLVENRQKHNLPSIKELVPKQISTVGRGAKLAFVIFILWYILVAFLVPIPHTAISEELVNLGIRVGVALLFLFVFLAMYRYQLWGAHRIVIFAAVWVSFLALLGSVIQGITSWFESLLIPLIGIITYGILAYLPFEETLTPIFYRLVWQNKTDWHNKLLEISNQFRRPRNGQTDIPGVLNVLTETFTVKVPQDNVERPPKLATFIRNFLDKLFDRLDVNGSAKRATAAWLLLSSSNPDERLYRIYDVGHDDSCEGACQGLLANNLGRTAQPDVMRLPKDLHQSLLKVIRGPEEILVVEGLTQRSRIIRTIHQVVNRLAKKFWLVHLIFHHEQYDLSICNKTCVRLLKARIAILIPLGDEQALRGIYVIASDGRGDYYDKQDRKALAGFAHDLSIWLSNAHLEPTIQ